MKKSLIVGLIVAAAMAVPAMAATKTLDCMSCHGSTGAKYPLLGAKLGYEVSGHATMGDSRYANGDSCQRCHTNEGYIEYVTKFNFDAAKYDAWATTKDKNGQTPYVAYPSQQGCFTCHDPHSTGDFALRTQSVDKKTKKVVNAKITLYNGSTFDAGAGNLCASCHQERGDMAKAVANAKGIVSVRGNSHHGPEADMLSGTNGYEFAGKKYGSSPHYSVVEDSCVTCHMTQPAGRYGLSPEVGGHAFTVSGEVHEAPVGITTSCATCHSGIKAVPGQFLYLGNSGTAELASKTEALFTVKAKADYDGNGKVELVQQEVAGLILKLQAAFEKMPNPILKADGTFVGGNKTVYSNDVVGAYQNYLFVIEDKSLGVHNATYAIELLMDSIKAVDPTFDDSARP